MITTKKKRRAIAAAALIVASAGILAASQQASANLSNVGGTSFEGNDANTAGAAILANGGIDWANLVASGGTLSTSGDAATGQCDNSFTQGSKEDETAVVIGQGSIPNSKADLGQFAVGSLVLDGGPRDGNVVMALAWIRNNLSGTTNFDFEINQQAQPNMTFAACPQADRAVTLVRRGDAVSIGNNDNGPGGPLADDLLISYDVQGGAQNPTLSFRRWTGTAWSSPRMITSANSEGALNVSNVITTAQLGPFVRVPGTTGTTGIPAAAFGEGDIDLTALGIIPNQNDPNAGCIAFGSAYVKSRASSAFTAQMKDYIAPIAIGLDTCSSIKVIKQTDPDGATQSFDFTRTGPGTAFDAPFALTDGGENLVSGLSPGTYTVAETGEDGWTLDSATCTGGTGDTPGNITLGANEDVVCTFNNVLNRGTIIIDKVTNPDPDLTGTVFDFVPVGFGANFTLTNDQTPAEFTGILPGGTYSITESAETGWTPTPAATCDNGSSPSAISVSPGETVTCTFYNEGLASLHIVKETDPRGQAGSFDFTTTGLDPASFSLSDNGVAQDFLNLPAGVPYFVDEVQPGGGFSLQGVVCTNGDDPQTGGLTDGVTLAPGEDVTCTFTNTASASIHYVKQAERTDGTVFDFDGDFTFTLEDAGVHDENGLALANYGVTEGDEPGWNLVSDDCDNGQTAGSVDLTASGQSVTCTFVNELERGAIGITKTTVKGNAPMANVHFTVTDVNGAEVGDGTTNDAGVVCVSDLIVLDGPFTVHEDVPTGYVQDNNDQVTEITEGDCTNAAPLVFENIPLTDVFIQVIPQATDGTASTIVCDNGAASSDPLVFESLPTLESLSLRPGTYTCTIVIDP